MGITDDHMRSISFHLPNNGSVTVSVVPGQESHELSLALLINNPSDTSRQLNIVAEQRDYWQKRCLEAERELRKANGVVDPS